MSFRKMSLDGLKLGEIYFIVVFDDEDLSIPIIQTLRYIGEFSDDSESINVYFSLIGNSEEESTIFVRKGNVPDLVLDRAQLLRFWSSVSPESFLGRRIYSFLQEVSEVRRAKARYWLPG